jgi:hypothetical protein
MKSRKKFLEVFLCTILTTVLFFQTSSALLISEIHPSSSASREWVEIFNNSDQAYDLTDHKFFEDDVRRSISTTSLATTFILNAGEYALLVDDLPKFQSSYPSYTGKVFRTTSFDLHDDKEILELRTSLSNWKTPDGICYKKENITLDKSLAFNGTEFIPAEETPGTGTLNTSATSIYISGSCTPSTNTNTNNTSTTTESTTTDTTVETFVNPTYFYRSYWPESEKIYVSAGENRIGLAGGDIIFEGRAITGDKKSAPNTNFFWSFGDGETAEGKKVLHVYKYPGEYTVDLEGYNNGYKSNNRIYIKVVNSDLKIRIIERNLEKVVEITNASKNEIDIGGYSVKTSGGEFEYTKTLPKILSILPNKSILLSQETLNFATSTTKVALTFPNGKEMVVFENIVKNADLKNASLKINKPISPITVSVFTKEDFERMAKVPSTPTSTTARLKKTTNYLSVKSSSAKTEPVVIKTQAKMQDSKQDNTFVVKSNNYGILQNVFRYFGI